jgi:hypothetical protein
MNRPPDRQRYRPGGGLDPIPFLVLVVLTAGAAILAAYVVQISSPLTFPGAVVGPLVASLPLAGVVAIAVRVGKCRNPWVGALLGVFAGAIVHLGAFQFALAAAKGDDHILRIDRLPAWLDEHVHNTDLWNPKFKALRGAAPWPVRPEELAFRWGVLAFGLFTGAVFPATAGWIMGAKPFSEAHGRWLKAWPVRLTHRSGAAVAEALCANSPEALRAAINALPPGTQANPEEGFTNLVVEYLPGEADAPVYLSAAVMTVAKGHAPWPKWLFSRWELTPEEAAALADGLLIPNAAFDAQRAKTRPGERVSTAIGARIVSLPDQDAGLILSSGNLWLATFVGFIPLIFGLTLAGAAAAVAAVYYDDLGLPEFIAVIVGGVLSLVASLAWLALYADYLPARYLHAQACRIIAQRPDPYVLPDDPGAFFVQMIPRKNWGRIMLENAEEVGFMRLDETRGVILYEGDRERWAIPRESVVSYELEAFDIGPSDPNIGPAFWLVVLKVNADGRVWEVPLAPRPVTLVKLTPTTRRLDAERLQKLIRRVVEPDEEEDE